MIKVSNGELLVDYYETFGQWNNFLDSNFLCSKYMRNVFKFLYEVNKTGALTTKIPKNVFKVFKLTDPKKLKAVIVVNTFENKTGIPYGVPVNEYEKECIGLLNIKKEIEVNFYKGLDLNFDSTLESWLEQGVLLLNINAASTEFDSYEKYLAKFYVTILQTLSANITGLTYCFWGKDVVKYIPFVSKVSNYVLTCKDPEMLSPKDEIWGCGHFDQINRIIYGQNELEEELIKW